jgi:hypothetical protein
MGLDEAGLSDRKVDILGALRAVRENGKRRVGRVSQVIKPSGLGRSRVGRTDAQLFLERLTH